MRVAVIVLVSGFDVYVEVGLDLVDESDVVACELAGGAVQRSQMCVEKSGSLVRESRGRKFVAEPPRRVG